MNQKDEECFACRIMSSQKGSGLEVAENVRTQVLSGVRRPIK